jgi:hypothetical protein
MAKKRDKYKKEYALYNGDEFVAVGTMKEISQMTRFSYSAIRNIKTRTPKNIERNKGYMLFEVEGGSNE